MICALFIISNVAVTSVTVTTSFVEVTWQPVTRGGMSQGLHHQRSHLPQGICLLITCRTPCVPAPPEPAGKFRNVSPTHRVTAAAVAVPAVVAVPAEPRAVQGVAPCQCWVPPLDIAWHR